VDKTLQIWADRILNLVQVQYTVHNPHHAAPVQGQPTIVMCNHSSLYDIPLSFKAFPHHSLRMLAKKELSRLPVMGKGMEAAEFPFIDRNNKKQAIKNLQTVRELLKSGIVMWIAPEGTRSKDGLLAPFKKGPFITAIQAQATIIPIVIRGAYDILPARSLQFTLGQKAEIHIGHPIDASQFTIEHKEILMEKVHQIMEKLYPNREERH
jgi:1-acyl-sn-glycerol-3-phosphate acyltransferase